eukprot:TRINITY_DN11491_c0_g1_i1.p1 TRINITY_DN11491_c0_g1~~TRINITY_DN11491_c0_g1_i1.p1  ORF type:complete len:268 (+),score=47.60 TRINITY_DN11491_c0_g1_i1:94-804(+)
MSAADAARGFVGASFVAGMLAGGAATGVGFWFWCPSSETNSRRTDYRRKLYVMRGVSGSGKSTLGRDILKKELASQGLVGGIEQYPPLARAFILSTDDFFADLEGANAAEHYVFDFKKLATNHKQNQNRCEIAMELGITPLIVDNTNTCLWEMRPYVELAKKHGYTVEVVDSMKGQDLTLEILKQRVAARPTAGKEIPDAALERMLKRYETLPDDPEAAEAAILKAENPYPKKTTQ